ncbi:hypothetical protein E1I69_10585 [Bacillus timonensis]|uniref:Uncharacterized protein n=1 Tax=Bacillus timonensis TaxID=1033734 RepID=A0A4S3PUM3_9BACI|nr:hypothetical protein [Bacillus timonensis]THE12632.1 hypothetical protein E1I69_10585 [Bacillus timonensis]
MCPKSRHLQIKESQTIAVMSEDDASSDKGKPNHRGYVRSRGIFRQRKAKILRLCPKSRHLLTKDSQNIAVVSEVEASSDKGKPNHRGYVRSQGIFGQGKAKPSRLCPKSRHLQTKESQTIAVMSEVEASSDKGQPKYHGCVRSRVTPLILEFTLFSKHAVACSTLDRKAIHRQYRTYFQKHILTVQ